MEWVGEEDDGWWFRILPSYPWPDWVGDIRWFRKENGRMETLDFVYRELVD